MAVCNPRFAFDFGTKQRLNMFVIDEMASTLFPGAKGHDLDEAYNSAAVMISDDTHKLIQTLADSIEKDVANVKSVSQVAAKVAVRWTNAARRER